MKEPLHLTPDELDLWLDGKLSPARASHLATCDECRTIAEETREVVVQLQALPQAEPRRDFADTVLARFVAAGGARGAHLSDEELDDWVSDVLPVARQAHLRACPECRPLADRERLLVLRLRDLPLFDPAPGFVERVIAEVDLPVISLAGAWRQWRRRTFANPVAVGIASGIAVVLGGSLAASAAWAAGNQEVITGASQWVWHGTQQLFWVTVAALSQLVTAQPWYPAIRSVFSPGRVALLGGALTALYGIGLMALRRLLAVPAGQAARVTL
jgi:hypothetical protein